MQYCQEKLTGNAGFSLVDAIIAMAVFSIGILAMGVLYNNVIRSNSNAFIMTDAIELTSGYLERIQAAPYTSLPQVTSLHGAKTYTVNPTMTPCNATTCVQNSTDITLVVTKPDGRSYTLSTVKARISGMP